MIGRGVTVFLILLVSVYIAVVHGVRRFGALGLAPTREIHDNLQFWGFVYLLGGALIFFAGCALGFYWLVQELNRSAEKRK